MKRKRREFSFKRLSNLFSIRSLGLLTCFLLIIYIFVRWGINHSETRIINSTLITVSGIFSALVITTLMSGLSFLIKRRFELKERIKILSEKLTYFRRLLYYVIHSPDFWGDKDFNRFAGKINRLYPKINAHNQNSSLSEFKELKESKHCESRKTKLYLNILTIVDVKSNEEMYFIQPPNKYKYPVRKLNYYHDCFNGIWYFLIHKSAAGIKDTPESLSILYREDFTEAYEKITGEKITSKEFSSNLLVSLGHRFYEEINPDLIDMTKEITNGLPNTYRNLIINLTLILIFGLIIPLMILATNFPFANYSTFICVGLTILLMINLIFYIWDFAIKGTNVF